MSANGKKWSQYTEETALADDDEVLVRNISEAAAAQVKRMTKANLSTDLGLSGHLADSSLHMTKDAINDRTNARQAANGVHYDGTAKNDASNNAATDAGLGDVTIAALVTVPDSLSTTNTIGGTRTSAAGYWFFLRASGALGIMIQDTSANAVSSTDDGGSLAGRTVHIAAVIDRTANTLTRYVDGVALATVDDCSAVTATITNANGFHMGHRNSDFYLDGGVIHSALPYNRALTAAQILKLAKNGNVPEVADQFGGAGNLYSGDSNNFASSLGNWAEQGSTSITVQQSGGKGQITNTASATGVRGLVNNSSKFTQFKRYRLSFKCRCSSGVGQEMRVRAALGGAFSEISKAVNGTTTSNYFNFTPTGSELEYSCEIVGDHTADDSILFDCAPNTGAGEIYDFDDIVLEPIGATVVYLPENIQSDGSIIDASSNELNTTATNATPLLRKPQVSGAFTPVLYFGGVAQTTGVNSGHWWADSNNPNLIFFTMRIESPSAVSDSGVVTAGGLPFSSVNSSVRRFTPAVIPSGMTGLTGSISAVVSQNASTMSFYQSSATGIANITNSECTTSLIFTVSGFYEKA